MWSLDQEASPSLLRATRPNNRQSASNPKAARYELVAATAYTSAEKPVPLIASKTLSSAGRAPPARANKERAQT